MSYKNLTMTIGAAGSGKSTWIEREAAYDARYDDDTSIYVISSDSIRKELYGDESDQAHNAEVFKEVHRRIHAHLNEPGNVKVYYDATNLSRKRRMDFLKTLSEEVEKVAIVFCTPFEIIMKRMENRERKVPEYVVQRHLKQLEFPQWFEGWDHITAQAGAHIYSNKIFNDMMIPHDNHHHKYDVIQHSINVARHFTEVPEWVFHAALLHDCGKPFTKQFINMKGETTFEAHYYGHEHYGAQMVFCALFDKPMGYQIAVAQLIDLHMERYRRNEEGMEKLYKLLDTCKVPHWVEYKGYRVTSSWLKLLNSADTEEA